LASSPSRLDGLNAGRGAEVNGKRVEANVTGVLKHFSQPFNYNAPTVPTQASHD
ncbi:hypothetical protein KUCAC02_030581, partial [Chaenocephalus aceratus]